MKPEPFDYLLAAFDIAEQAERTESGYLTPAGQEAVLAAAGGAPGVKDSAQRVKPSPFEGRKSLLHYYVKGAGEPCKQGETSASTGCTPASGEASAAPMKAPPSGGEDPAKAIKAKLVSGAPLTPAEIASLPSTLKTLTTHGVANLLKKVTGKIPDAAPGKPAKHQYFAALIAYAKAKSGGGAPATGGEAPKPPVEAPKPKPTEPGKAPAASGPSDEGAIKAKLKAGKPLTAAEIAALPDILKKMNTHSAAALLKKLLGKDPVVDPKKPAKGQYIDAILKHVGSSTTTDGAMEITEFIDDDVIHIDDGEGGGSGSTPEPKELDIEAIVAKIKAVGGLNFGPMSASGMVEKLLQKLSEVGEQSSGELAAKVADEYVKEAVASGTTSVATKWKEVKKKVVGYTGSFINKAGAKVCYEKGKQVPCPDEDGTPPKPAATATGEGKKKTPVQQLAADFPDIAAVYAGMGGEKVALKIPKDSDAGKDLAMIPGVTWSNSNQTFGVPAHAAMFARAVLEKHNLGGFPKDPANLEVVKKLGGHSGGEATLVKDEKGNLWVRKKVTGPQTEAEVAADAAYAAIGLDVPTSKIVGGYKLAKYQEGTNLGEFIKKNPALAADIIAKVRAGFVADALLGNWDVIGATQDNILVGKDGKVYRIDNGGSLNYRAQGAKKTDEQWGDTVPDIDSMRDPKTNPQAAGIFGGITDAEIGLQVQELLSKKDALLKAVPEGQRKRVEARLAWLAKKYMPKQFKSKDGWSYIDVSPWKTTPPDASTVYKFTPEEKNHPMLKQYGDTDIREGYRSTDYALDDKGNPIVVEKTDPKTGETTKKYQKVGPPKSLAEHVAKWKSKVAGPEFDATKSYTNGGYHALNEALKKCPDTLDCMDAKHTVWHKNIDAALAKAGVLEQPITVWRYVNVNEKDTMEFFEGAAAAGDVVKMNGYKSCTTNPGGWSGNVCFEIKAKTGVYAEPFSHHKGGSEQEFLQGHGTKYRVLGVKTVKMKLPYGGTKDQKVIQLEEVL